MTTALERKDFLRIFAAAGAGLALGVELAPPAAQAAVADPKPFSPMVWLRMAHDGTTTAVLNISEMGESATTGLSMMLADELDVPFSSMRFEFAPAETRYYNPFWHGMTTAGSKSTLSMGPIMRQTGATARAMLVAAAAQRWNVDPKTLSARDAVVKAADGRSLRYTELLDAAATIPVPTDVPLKTPDQWRIMGTSQKRLDLLPKTNGTAQYGLDVRLPGMKYASIQKPDQIGGKVASFDAADALRVPGVIKVFEVPSGVAVVAENTWAAFEGRKRLRVTYAPGPNAGLTTETIFSKARDLVKTPGVVVKSVGDATAALSGDGVITAEYEVPYLAHAPMEPMNATADVRADRVQIWVPTQAPTTDQKVAAAITGLPLEAVHVQPTFLGGGFGRRTRGDFTQDAVWVSKQAGVPIKVVWTREDDVRHDLYRPGAAYRLSGKLAPDGTIAAYRHTLACSSIYAEAFPAAVQNGLDKGTIAGSGNFEYTIPNQLVDYHQLTFAIPVYFWRAPYANANWFPTESFVDELAHAAGKDPVAFRLAMLPAGVPSRAALERAAKLANWGAPLPAGRARGVAVTQYDGAWTALVAEISMPEGKLKIHKLVTSTYVGNPINPAGLQQQIPSAVIFGLTAALWGKIDFQDGATVQTNFDKYPMLKMAGTPEIVIDIVPNHDKLTGAGEVATPPVAPALANAIFALTGQRIRKMPLSDSIPIA